MHSRANPSPRYRALLRLYRQMHEEGARHQNLPAEETFDGRSLLPHGGAIAALARQHAARTILDYGSGKGLQYKPIRIELEDGQTFDSMAAFWKVDRVTCYDPGYEPFSTLPDGPFDGVVCTDVLEHCPEDDIPWIVDELFSFAEKFIFANVANYPAQKRLPTGENAHETMRPTSWWQDLFSRIGERYPQVRYYVAVDSHTPEGRLEVDRFDG